MIKCPHCDSSVQSDPFEVEYQENGWTIKVIRWYRCKCGWGFTTSSFYHGDGYEEIEDPYI